MNIGQLREYIIKPVLKYLDLYSPSAEELLLMTAAQESHAGEYIHQLGKGPALGIYEMEPATHDSLWNNYLAYRAPLAVKIKRLNGAWRDDGDTPDAEEMVGNIFYSTAMARIRYKPVPKALPPADQIEALAQYYKTYYNTARGAATVPEVIRNYHRFIA